MSYFKEMKERLEEYENSSKQRLMKGLPILCRLDGSSFSKFVKGLETPYDERLSNLMIESCKFLVEKTNARVGFVGSDEISLILWEENENSELIYNEIISHNGKAIMSIKEHESGSDRIAEAVENMDADIIINVQGDEPFINKTPLEQIITAFQNDSEKKIDLASLMFDFPITASESAGVPVKLS